MGYTTEFDGSVSISPPLNAHEIAYLRKFAASRRMDRARGPYFVDGSGPFGQGHDDDIRDFNKPPAGQPGLWCWWEPTKDGTAIKWNGVEKFYSAARDATAAERQLDTWPRKQQEPAPRPELAGRPPGPARPPSSSGCTGRTSTR